MSKTIEDLCESSFLLSYLLKELAVRPGMCFGSEEVSDLSLHLSGWRLHRMKIKDGDIFADAFFNRFDRFVEEHYNDNRTVGWAALIEEHLPSDQRNLDVFFELLTEFALSDPAP
ncbi:MAG: hypothetical protein OXC60_01270 [Litoreibacter sp.]|nr:hypothetical protein [Litoreibacter sp.]MCY4333291.1 hypothetical protein [Litoreibacter sp.]